MSGSLAGIREAGGPVTKPPPGLLTRSRGVLNRLDRATRDARRMIREMERLVDFDLWGRYNIMEDEQIDDEIVGDVIDLLHRARMENPGQEIEIIFVSHLRTDDESSERPRRMEEDNGTEVRHIGEDS